MVITPSRAVIELPTLINWELEDTPSAIQDQRATPSERETKPSIESACERVGYSIGRFLGDVVQARQQFRSVQMVSSPNSGAAAKTASATSVATPADRQLLTSGYAPVSLAVCPRRYQVSVIIARVLRNIKTLATELVIDFRVALKDVLKSRIAKFALACIIGSVAAEVVLRGFGAFSLVAHSGIPRLTDIIREQSIDLSSSIGEFVLGFMLSPYVAEITITGLVILALILYRRWEIKHSRVAAGQTN